jgi:hypothetical protein
MAMDDCAAALERLEARNRTLLPKEYEESYEEVAPVSMGSAGLRYGQDGRVAWDQMWDTFCDLAMAGGPPHRGRLLEPARLHEIEANPEAYAGVVTELCRAVAMTTELAVQVSPVLGWVRVSCYSDAMAQWLLRAIVIENVSARADGTALDLPAGPAYRVEKEIKNVVTAAAKTCHYWLGHTTRPRRQAIAITLAAMTSESPLVVPDQTRDTAMTLSSIHVTQQRSGLTLSSRQYAGWLGLNCPTVQAAIWMMRIVMATNVLSRREETTLFVPINPAQDPDGERVASAVATAHRLAKFKGIVGTTMTTGTTGPR